MRKFIIRILSCRDRPVGRPVGRAAGLNLALPGPAALSIPVSDIISVKMNGFGWEKLLVSRCHPTQSTHPEAVKKIRGIIPKINFVHI
jgi:hypothetical protein